MIDKSYQILVVDDDAFVKDMIKHILECFNQEVQTAENGLDALTKLSSDHSFDLIISDMDMPKMNGLELIHHVRKNGDDIPIIILTGNKEIRIAIEAMKNGADDYLLKDENIDETLLISIKNVMEKHQLKLENKKLIEDLARKNKELERLSYLDGLTNIGNRRYFDQVIYQEWRRSLRNESDISVIMIDIDYFKLYNDTYGHQEGDICLQKVAGALSSTLKRSGDFIARYGGEEFSAILPDTDIPGACTIAESMITNVANLQIPHSSSACSNIVTISIGIGWMIPTEDSNLNELISKADQALYQAKKGGRNQYQVFTNIPKGG